MSTQSRKAMALVLVMAFLGSAALPFGGVGEGRSGGGRGPVPMAGDPVWTDPLDDLSHVYMTDRVDVAGGEARLAAGEPQGWLASEVITCPSGYKYDLVYLEAVLPGASYMQISVLDASEESGEVGYANATIPLHVKVNGTDHSVFDISPWLFPSIRIQVNLVASGSDRPRLLAWSLYYIALDEWHDEFLGTGKMSEHKGLNLTGGGLEVNLTGNQGGGGGGDYEAYPPIAYSYYSLNLFYPNSAHTTYQDQTSLTMGQARGVKFGELNGDGVLDLVATDTSGNARIFWGSSEGTYSDSDRFELTTTKSYSPGIGDFNGDGWNDVAIGWYASSSSSGTEVFLNNGDGTFNSASDISLNDRGYMMDVGDVNADGFDDIIQNQHVFYGGPTGPGSSPDVTFGPLGAYCTVKDVDLDGIDDVLVWTSSGQRIDVYLGSASGFDATSDFNIPSIPFYVMGCGACDVNGDGYIDIAIMGEELSDPYPFNLIVYEGKADGWVTTSYHTVMNDVGFGYATGVGDIDKDGYDDIVICSGDSTFSLKVFRGGDSWPSAPPDITKTTSNYGMYIDIAIPKGGGGVRSYRGTFTTAAIDLPPGKKWDILHLDGTFPQNTSMKLSVLDGAGREISGFKGLTDTDVDLSSLDTMLYGSIKVKVTLMSEFNWTTPVLDRLTVKWMDKGTWRDEFYGGAKIERMLNIGVVGGELARSVATGPAPQLLYTGLRGPAGYDVPPQAYVDGGGLDYTALPPIPFASRGVSAVDASDVNGDGFMDVAFAVRQTSDTTYVAQSPLFLGSAVGWRVTSDTKFPTTGATDVLLRDLNGDGNVDVVFAQDYDGTSYRVNSTLFWGKAGGDWNATPDVLFATNGASGLAAADLDGDGRLDLAFACYRDASSTSTDSMVFLQGATGFCGTVPSYKLPTKGARAVAAGDVNRDGRMDLAFANSISGGSAEIDSYIYWGKAGGGFETTPKGLRTSGAADVELADLDGDGDLDAVFANQRNNVPIYKVDSCIYLNDGSGGFSSTPDVRLPTVGAVAVTVADLDGTGRKDLVFACQYNGSSYEVPSVVYLGGTTGWSTSPDISLPTVGASDVLVGHLIRAGQGGYMSRPITPEDPAKTGAFHTFRYTARLGTQQSGTLQLIDAMTWETLAETTVQAGTHEWLVKDLFWVKEHPSVRAVIMVTGLGQPGEFAVDDLWLNWTARVMLPPQVLGLSVTQSPLYRLDACTLLVDVEDEYDPPDRLGVTVEYRLNGTTGAWSTGGMLGLPGFVGGFWNLTVRPRADAALGTYDFRVTVKDSDFKVLGPVEFPNVLEVLNNVPTAPVVRIMPQSPITTVSLRAEIVTPATDRETPITNHYAWYCDGVLMDALTGDTVSSALTTKGQNWSVEVRAIDNDGAAGPAGVAWVVIANAPPGVGQPLPSPELGEDTVDDQWLDLSVGFSDPDGDALAYTLTDAPEHIQVTIGPDGKVTLRPDADWSGQESATFVASDGELTATQTVLITVTPVDDIPWFTTVNGGAITTDPVHFDIMQGELLVITVGTQDVEGDGMVYSVNTTAVTVDEATGEIRFQPGNEAVGTLRFALTMSEAGHPDVKVRLNLTITVVNVNDPMDAPSITNPKAGDAFKANKTFSLMGVCTDPDTVYGQVLNFTWWWNGTNLIGYGSSLTTAFLAAGNYTITLRVTDGEYTKEASVGIVIEAVVPPLPPPPPPPPPPDEGMGAVVWIGALIALVIIGGVIFLVMSRRRAAEKEAADEAEEKHEAFKQMAVAVKETAEQMEREVAEARAAKPVDTAKVVIETRGPGGEVTQATAAEMGTLSMVPQETEAPSADVARLFKDMETSEPQVSAKDSEALRVESLKRKYQTAISRLPYGIPAAALKDKDWGWLAGALATGEKKTIPDGRETTKIEGRWYYSDVKDASSFLTEHGAKPKAEPRKASAASAAPTMDKATLLAKLEERLVLGEISEETYKELKKKFEE